MRTETRRALLFCALWMSILFGTAACRNKPLSPASSGTETHGIIPLPKQLDFTGDKLVINQDFVLVKSNLYKIAALAAEDLLSGSVLLYKSAESPSPGTKNFQFVNDVNLPQNGCEIDVTSGGITIRAGGEPGAYWAVQTLKQYFRNTTGGKKVSVLELPGIHIVDRPNYEWRGFHLDLSRHMFTKEYILQIIDWLASYKFNKLHLHLTDDQGWRLESRKFPLLNEIGSWRTFDRNDSICMQKAKSDPGFAIDTRFIRTVNGKTEYGGYYRNSEMKEIISYAQNHFIEVIPEIDMPGHMSAAIRAYPYLSCTGSTGWGTEFSYPMCPCSNGVFDFSFQVYDEILELFPSAIVHIGADEVEMDTWKQSQACKDFMRVNNLLNVREIQSFFIGKLQKHLEGAGKTVIAWDDVMDGQADPNLKIMYWRDWVKDAPAKAAANGNQIIFTRWDLFYLSSTYSEDILRKTLEFDVQKEYPKAVTDRIIGFQGCVWTEEIPSQAVFEAQVFPRLQALSEVCWSGARDWNSFVRRLKPHLAFFRESGVNTGNFPD